MTEESWKTYNSEVNIGLASQIQYTADFKTYHMLHTKVRFSTLAYSKATEEQICHFTSNCELIAFPYLVPLCLWHCTGLGEQCVIQTI